MEITVTFNYGPLNAEFTGEDREKVQRELLEFANFIEEEKDTLSQLSTSSVDDGSGNEEEQTSATDWIESDSQTESGTSKFASLARKTGIDEEILNQIFKLPDNDEGVPSLNMYHFGDGTLALGKARNQRQSQASALLLYVWEECLDQKKIDYEKLDDALIESDVETERRDAMTQAFSQDAGDWFESDTSRIWLIGQGKNHARELLHELTEEIEGV
ncbi:hypothetical protein [Natrinema altunense]|uniref:Uncharacterized protein n=1 Tax=Natrinema altunense TaxID=222984 RepID=A0A482XXU7_9EURY|nr:hypothetical protein [Natrinema altunense]RZH67992.1 hypothetical protein ELS17_00535 [Natrinema altunense]